MWRVILQIIIYCCHLCSLCDYLYRLQEVGVGYFPLLLSRRKSRVATKQRQESCLPLVGVENAVIFSLPPVRLSGCLSTNLLPTSLCRLRLFESPSASAMNEAFLSDKYFSCDAYDSLRCYSHVMTHHFRCKSINSVLNTRVLMFLCNFAWIYTLLLKGLKSFFFLFLFKNFEFLRQ